MGCLLSLLLTLGPRLVLLFMWLFTERIALAFDGFLVPLLGFIFLPFTTMFYAMLWHPVDGISGFAWIFIGVAVLFDIGAYAGTAYGNRSRLPSQDG